MQMKDPDDTIDDADGEHAAGNRSDSQPSLPFDDLPSPTDPPQDDHWHVGPEVKDLLDGVDWQMYEANVVQSVREAVGKFCRLHNTVGTDKIYQISIWTDAQAGITAVNFETRQHADEFRETWIQQWQEGGRGEWAEEMVRLPYSSSPADFKYKEFLVVRHPELERLMELDYSVAEKSKAANVWIEASLLRVVERIVAEDTLSGLPREDVVWIGISSPRDWYDHVRKI